MDRIENVEIFRTGTWKGRTFVESDLDEMVTNWREFSISWFRPAIKGGHDSTPGQPAWGYLDNVRRVGSKLLADLVDLPVKIYEMIRDKRFDRVSAEIMPSFTKGGRTYGKVLSALAILGPEIPEVTGLRPLRECFNGYGYVYEIYDTPLTINREVSDMTTEEAGLELDRRIKIRLIANSQLEYLDAMNFELDLDPGLKVAYAAERVVPQPKPITTMPPQPDDPVIEGILKGDKRSVRDMVDRYVQQWMVANADYDYRRGLEEVFRKYPDLKVAYMNS